MIYHSLSSQTAAADTGNVEPIIEACMAKQRRASNGIPDLPRFSPDHLIIRHATINNRIGAGTILPDMQTLSRLSSRPRRSRHRSGCREIRSASSLPLVSRLPSVAPNYHRLPLLAEFLEDACWLPQGHPMRAPSRVVPGLWLSWCLDSTPIISRTNGFSLARNAGLFHNRLRRSTSRPAVSAPNFVKDNRP